MTQLPALSMVVLEDVDALFTNHREADQNNSSLCLECRGALCGQLSGQLLLLFLKPTAANYPFGTPHVLPVIFRFSGPSVDSSTAWMGWELLMMLSFL